MEQPTVRVIAFTQDHENYGDETRPHWKAKGGIEVLVAAISLEEALKGKKFLEGLVDAACEKIVVNNEMFERYVINWDLFFEGEMTPDEEMQMEYEGRIIYPPKTLDRLYA